MIFPTLVYKIPGAHFGPKGTTYDYLGVRNQDELDSAIQRGYFVSLHEAVELHLNPKKVPLTQPSRAPSPEPEIEPEPESQQEPSRDEVLAEAVRLKIPFKTKDSTEKIYRKVENYYKSMSGEDA